MCARSADIFFRSPPPYTNFIYAGVYIIQTFDIFARPPFFQNDIFSPQYIENFLLSPFFNLLLLKIFVLFLHKSSYFFPNRPYNSWKMLDMQGQFNLKSANTFNMSGGDELHFEMQWDKYYIFYNVKISDMLRWFVETGLILVISLPNWILVYKIATRSLLLYYPKILSNTKLFQTNITFQKKHMTLIISTTSELLKSFFFNMVLKIAYIYIKYYQGILLYHQLLSTKIYIRLSHLRKLNSSVR